MAGKKGATVDDIYEMLTGDGSHLPKNVGLFEGKLDGKKVAYVCATNKDDENVPIALILDEKTRKLISSIVDEPEDDEDEDEDEDEDSDDEAEDFKP